MASTLHVLLAVLGCLFLMNLVMVQAAPLTGREQPGDNLARKSRLKRADQIGTRLFVELNDNFDLDSLLTGAVRNKRHAVAGNDSLESPALEELLESSRETGVSRNERRRRRSAAFLLHATIQLCNKHRYLCHRIDVAEDDVKLSVRLHDS